MNRHIDIMAHYNIEFKAENSDEIILRNRNTQELVFMKQITVEGIESLKQMIQTLETQKNIRNQNILALLDYQLRERIVSPSSTISINDSYEIAVIYEKGSHTLQEQILTRISSNAIEPHYFDEAEIWSILYSIVKGLTYLQKEGIGHGCITTDDIFLTEDGKTKIVDPSLASYSPYQFSEGYYYSPQMIQKFNSGLCKDKSTHYEYQQIDIYKSDVFSLGMCLLRCALLEQCDDCYDYQELRLKPNILKRKFNGLVGVYSQQFLDIVYQMMSFDIDKRPNFKQLLSYVEHYIQEQEWSTKNNLRKINHKQNIDRKVDNLHEDLQDQENNQFIFLEETQSEQFDQEQSTEEMKEDNKLIPVEQQENMRSLMSFKASFIDVLSEARDSQSKSRQQNKENYASNGIHQHLYNANIRKNIEEIETARKISIQLNRNNQKKGGQPRQSRTIQ